MLELRRLLLDPSPIPLWAEPTLRRSGPGCTGAQLSALLNEMRPDAPDISSSSGSGGVPMKSSTESGELRAAFILLLVVTATGVVMRLSIGLLLLSLMLQLRA